MLRISFFTILLLTGCQGERVQNPVIGQIQQIESPLQNTVEGMAKAMPPELVLSRLGNLLDPWPIRPQPVVEYVAAAIPN